jgi:hypothetical protein
MLARGASPWYQRRGTLEPWKGDTRADQCRPSRAWRQLRGPISRGLRPWLTSIALSGRGSRARPSRPANRLDRAVSAAAANGAVPRKRQAVVPERLGTAWWKHEQVSCGGSRVSWLQAAFRADKLSGTLLGSVPHGTARLAFGPNAFDLGGRSSTTCLAGLSTSEQLSRSHVRSRYWSSSVPALYERDRLLVLPVAGWIRPPGFRSSRLQNRLQGHTPFE